MHSFLSTNVIIDNEVPKPADDRGTWLQSRSSETHDGKKDYVIEEQISTKMLLAFAENSFLKNLFNGIYVYL